MHEPPHGPDNKPRNFLYYVGSIEIVGYNVSYFEGVQLNQCNQLQFITHLHKKNRHERRLGGFEGLI